MTDTLSIFSGLVSRIFRNKATIYENDKERPKRPEYLYRTT